MNSSVRQRRRAALAAELVEGGVQVARAIARAYSAQYASQPERSAAG